MTFCHIQSRSIFMIFFLSFLFITRNEEGVIFHVWKLRAGFDFCIRFIVKTFRLGVVCYPFSQ